MMTRRTPASVLCALLICGAATLLAADPGIFVWESREARVLWEWWLPHAASRSSSGGYVRPTLVGWAIHASFEALPAAFLLLALTRRGAARLLRPQKS
jgi:hypothetical protein